MKNNSALRKQLVAIIILLLTALYIAMFTVIQIKVENEQKQNNKQESFYDVDTIFMMYRANSVLYRDAMAGASGDESIDAADAFGDEEQVKDATETQRKELQDILTSWRPEVESLLGDIDVYTEFEEDDGHGDSYSWKNTDSQLEEFLHHPTQELTEAMQKKYSFYVIAQYDEKGNMTFDRIWNENGNADTFIKTFQMFERDNREIQDLMSDYHINYKKMKNFKIMFACPKDNQGIQLSYVVDHQDWYSSFVDYQEMGGNYLYLAIMVLLGILAFVINFNFVKKEELINRREENGKFIYSAIVRYPTGLALVLIYCSLNVFPNIQYKLLYDSRFTGLASIVMGGKWKEITVEQVVTFLISIVVLYVCLILGYLSVYWLVPLFRIGLVKYLREYSFCLHFLPWTKQMWERGTQLIRHVDFTKKANRILFRIVIINFFILLAISFLWVVGIPLLIIYSVIVYSLMRKYYCGVSRDYQILLKAMGRIADGELDTDIQEDIGLFEPFKEEMGKIQDGFKKAVSQEVKSQKMKTELITNVSHDLKTPLTAITTYIELLQQENITEEQRAEYIKTLQTKTKRLTVLIEDLFEVSKATTENVTLDIQEVDIVGLIRQVGVEFEDKLAEQELTVNYELPNEKILLMLDCMKTYRIFENLYGNIVKYAMPHSRVYIDVTQEDKNVTVVLRNVSASELNFRADEITERFVKGDSSRNSEGYGLGLAIAKSFTELQKGKFEIVIDGDLFKVVLRFVKS